MEPQRTNSYILPIAILLGFGIIASVIFFADQNSGPDTRTALTGTANNSDRSMQEPVRTVQADDMIRGNPNAPLMFVTYLDYDCPTCKSYYYAMDRLVREQGIDGLVGWTFRPFPVAEDATVLNAAYCAGATDSQNFWEFSDLVFDDRDTNSPVDRSQLSSYASSTGVTGAEFEDCQNNNTFMNDIMTHAREVEAADATQAPFTVVMLNDEQEGLYGAQPYSILNQIVNNVRADIETQ